MCRLSIDVSHRSGSVALSVGSRIYSLEIGGSQQTAAWLMTSIDELFQRAKCRISQLKVIAVGTGPGSFTGIRIALTTAKTLAYARGIPVVGVNSLAAIAAAELNGVHPVSDLDAQVVPKFEIRDPRSPSDRRPDFLCVALNAYRRQAFVADIPLKWNASELDQDLLQRSFADADRYTQVIDHDRLVPHTVAGNAIICGLDLRKFPEMGTIANRVMQPQGTSQMDTDLPDSIEICAAIGVHFVAAVRIEQGRFDDPLRLLPNYFRGSAAEEKLSRE